MSGTERCQLMTSWWDFRMNQWTLTGVSQSTSSATAVIETVLNSMGITVTCLISLCSNTLHVVAPPHTNEGTVFAHICCFLGSTGGFVTWMDTRWMRVLFIAQCSFIHGMWNDAPSSVDQLIWLWTFTVSRTSVCIQQFFQWFPSKSSSFWVLFDSKWTEKVCPLQMTVF